MAPHDVRAAAEQLVEFHEYSAPLSGTEQARDHACDHLKGLMTCPERKSIEPIALPVGHGDVSGLQKFVGAAPWAHDDVMAEAQALLADELAPSAAGTPAGVVGVIDESAFAEKGRPSAGVARQHNGRLGKEDNCRVGVFLVGVTPAGSAPLDHRLFLPGSRCDGTPEAKGRRDRARIPEGAALRTKPRIAAESVRNVAVLDRVKPDWVVADAESGRAGPFLGELELLGQRNAPGVPVTWAFWTADPAGSIPAHSGRGRKPTAPRRDAEFAAVRVGGLRHREPGPPSRLLIRRSPGDEPELEDYASNADADTPLSASAPVACTRCRAEEYVEDCKSYLGMTRYGTRSRVGWHHHMAPVGLAHLFVTLARKRLPKKCRG